MARTVGEPSDGNPHAKLLRHGGLGFTYDDRGRRTSRTEGGATTRHDYDPFGNLRGVDLPDGTEVRYVVDAP